MTHPPLTGVVVGADGKHTVKVWLCRPLPPDHFFVMRLNNVYTMGKKREETAVAALRALGYEVVEVEYEVGVDPAVPE